MHRPGAFLSIAVHEKSVDLTPVSSSPPLKRPGHIAQDVSLWIFRAQRQQQSQNRSAERLGTLIALSEMYFTGRTLS